MKRRFPLLVSMLLTLTATSMTTNDPAPFVLPTYGYPAYDRAAALRPLAGDLSAHLAEPAEVLMHESPRVLGQPAQTQTNAYRQRRPLKPRSGPPSQPMRTLNT